MDSSYVDLNPPQPPKQDEEHVWSFRQQRRRRQRRQTELPADLDYEREAERLLAFATFIAGVSVAASALIFLQIFTTLFSLSFGFWLLLWLTFASVATYWTLGVYTVVKTWKRRAVAFHQHTDLDSFVPQRFLRFYGWLTQEYATFPYMVTALAWLQLVLGGVVFLEHLDIDEVLAIQLAFVAVELLVWALVVINYFVPTAASIYIRAMREVTDAHRRKNA